MIQFVTNLRRKTHLMSCVKKQNVIVFCEECTRRDERVSESVLGRGVGGGVQEPEYDIKQSQNVESL